MARLIADRTAGLQYASAVLAGARLGYANSAGAMPSQQQEVLLVRPRSKNFPGTSSNHNVVMNWMLKVSTGMADSIWSKTVLASYLYELMGQSLSLIHI